MLIIWKNLSSQIEVGHKSKNLTHSHLRDRQEMLQCKRGIGFSNESEQVLINLLEACQMNVQKNNDTANVLFYNL